jgi:hypothetical protein
MRRSTTTLADAAVRIGSFDLIVRTPDEAATLVASGCGCEDTESTFAVNQTFAVETGPLGQVTWSGVIGTEGELTGDGRIIEPNALRWENLPASLRYAPEDFGGHGGAQRVGRIMTIERRDNGDLWGTGDVDMSSPLGPEAARLMADGYGVSMDLDDVSFEIRVAKELLEEMPVSEEEAEAEKAEELEEPTDEDGRVTVIAIDSDDEVMAMTGGRVRGATLVDIPAFIRASLKLDNPLPEGGAEAQPAATQDDALVAGAAPMEPPAEWFQNPNLQGPTPLTITPDGRVFGHLAVWGTCHTAYTGQCVEPPHSPSDYAYFRTGAVLTAEGKEVAVGRITLDTMHASRNLSATDTLAHYEHTGKGAADVAAGEDVFGIWIAGALRPGLSAERVRTLRASPISGDWRRIGGSLELVAALAVNSPGFPVPRPQGLVASGAMQSLVASGMLMPDAPEEDLTLSAEDVRWLRTLATRERTAAEEEARAKAEALHARVRDTRAAVLARRAGVR